MTPRNVKLIFLREVRDQLRDRRTLFMVAVLPLLLYPALGIGMAQMLSTFAEQKRTVAIVGAADLPEPPLLDPRLPQQFRAHWFSIPDDADKLRVITDTMWEESLPGGPTLEEAEFLQAALQHRPRVEQLGQLTRRRERLEAPAPTAGPLPPDHQQELAQLRRQEDELKRELDAWFRTSPVQVLIVVPRGFRNQLDEITARLAAREPVDDLITAAPRPVILQNSADEKSVIAARRVREAIRNWNQQVLAQRLEAARLPGSLPSAVDATGVDLAADSEISATLWSKMFPLLLVIMAVTGAFYPAIDLGAGEKERGTMETLLISPASRAEIVVGKFLTVVLFSLSTALLNLVSMGITSKYMLTMAAAGQLSRLGNVAAFPPLSALVWLVVLAAPLAALFGALSLALAMFAKSSKEGQYYLTPLLLVTIGLAMFCISPAVEINPFFSVYPVVGPGLLLKSILLGQPQPHLWGYLGAVLLSSFGYAAIALWWAVEQFHSEEVLFREAERFELRAWMRHIFRDREPTPSFTEAGFCLMLILLLVFASWGFLSSRFTAAPSAAQLLKLQMVYLLVAIGTPPLLMAAMLTRSVQATLKLYWPGGRMLAAAVLLAIVIQPVSIELLASLAWFFPPLPEGVRQLFTSMRSEEVPGWLPLLAFAVAPAVCEELAFRGFILSGLERARNPWVPIILSSVAFGLTHMIPQQVFNATLLGVVIALLVLVSRSLLPGILFHFVFNGMQVGLERLGGDRLQEFAARTDQWLYRVETSPEGLTALRIEWPLLLPCVVASVLLVTWLIRSLPSRPGSPAAEALLSPDAPPLTLQRSGT